MEQVEINELKKFLKGKWKRTDNPKDEPVFYFYPKDDYKEEEEICLMDNLQNSMMQYKIEVHFKTEPQKNTYFIVDIDKDENSLKIMLNKDVFTLKKVVF